MMKRMRATVATMLAAVSLGAGTVSVVASAPGNAGAATGQRSVQATQSGTWHQLDPRFPCGADLIIVGGKPFGSPPGCYTLPLPDSWTADDRCGSIALTLLSGDDCITVSG